MIFGLFGFSGDCAQSFLQIAGSLFTISTFKVDGVDLDDTTTTDGNFNGMFHGDCCLLELIDVDTNAFAGCAELASGGIVLLVPT